MQHCIVIGGSHAAVQLAFSLRQEGWNGNITIISSDENFPYHRPPLSKIVLSSESSVPNIPIRATEFYEKNNINLLLGKQVLRIDREKSNVTLNSGEEINYTKLALTTGAYARKISIPGHNLKGVCYLRDLRDAREIRESMAPNKSAVIIGGGYIGLEAAASMRKRGMNVTILEAMPRVLARVTSPEVSAFYSRIHEEEGVTIITNASATAIEGADYATGVHLDDGRFFKADIVLIGIGVLPATNLACGAGLDINDGIMVDEFCRTNDHNIVAAGDCTIQYNPIYGKPVRLESIQNANDQAKIAAKTLCGKLETYSALPWFWSDQYDLKLQIAGLAQGFDNVILRGDPNTGRCFIAFYFKGSTLLSADCINSPKEFMAIKRLLVDKKTANPTMLSDQSINLVDSFID
tara:strand:- start:9220 stop:10440 length:1221 start_codon:yes stop_codon:yes gene_type:complete